MASFVLELEISFSRKLLTEYTSDPELKPGSIETLEKKLDTAAAIRNTAKSEALRRLHRLQHDRTYQSLRAEYAARKRRDKDADVSDLSAAYSECMSRYGYSEFDLQKYILHAKHQYSNILGADECQKLASQAFRAVDRIRTGQSKKASFLPRKSDTSVEGKSSKSTLKYIENGCVQFGKGNIYPLIVRKKDIYAQEALTHRVKYVRIVRRTIRGKHRYFAQLVMDGIPPRKKNLVYGSGRVGLDEGTSTIAIVSENTVSLTELAPDTAVNEKKLRRLNRAIGRSRRGTNPGNYNPDGTVRKGRLTWVRSKRCRRLEEKRKELYRKSAAKRRDSHNALANRITALGTDIRVEDMRIRALAKRSSKTVKNPVNGRIISKKRYGKTVMSRAPAMLIAAIDRKLRYIGLSVKKADTWHVKASQYDHKSNTCKKKPLSQRWHLFDNGTKVQRDLYSAFLIYNTNDTLDAIDRKACIRNYDTFKKLHDQNIAQLKHQNSKTMRWYIA